MSPARSPNCCSFGADGADGDGGDGDDGDGRHMFWTVTHGFFLVDSHAVDICNVGGACGDGDDGDGRHMFWTMTHVLVDSDRPPQRGESLAVRGA